jgi:hypothetical protein
MAAPEPSPEEVELDLAALIQQAVRAEFDPVVGHLVNALRRDGGVADLARRLDQAERRLAERDQRPLVAGLWRVLTLVRRLEFEPEAKTALELELTNLLMWSGYSELGEPGEPFDPVRHEAISAMPVTGAPVVDEVLEPGLETLGEIVVRAKVAVRSQDEEEQLQ